MSSVRESKSVHPAHSISPVTFQQRCESRAGSRHFRALGQI